MQQLHPFVTLLPIIALRAVIERAFSAGYFTNTLVCSRFCDVPKEFYDEKCLFNK